MFSLLVGSQCHLFNHVEVKTMPQCWDELIWKKPRKGHAIWGGWLYAYATPPTGHATTSPQATFLLLKVQLYFCLKPLQSGGRTASQGSWSPFLVAVFFPRQRQWSVVRSSPTSPRGFDAKKRRWSGGFSIVPTSIVGFRKQRGPTLWEGDAEVGGRGG